MDLPRAHISDCCVPVGDCYFNSADLYGGIERRRRQGVMIKSSHQLELLTKADTFVFDKTGTLTEGVFEVKKIHPEGMTEEELLELTAYIEYFSNHPISMSLQKMYKKEVEKQRIEVVQEIPGQGIYALIDGKAAYAGNRELLRELRIAVPKVRRDRYDRVCCTRWSLCWIYCDR